MSTAKHTPGPWEIFSDSMREIGVKAVTSPHNSGLDFIIVDEVRGDYREEPTGGSPYANARLIAAAPALLEYLDQALQLIDPNDVCIEQRDQALMREAADLVARLKGDQP